MYKTVILKTMQYLCVFNRWQRSASASDSLGLESSPSQQRKRDEDTDYKLEEEEEESQFREPVREPSPQPPGMHTDNTDSVI